MYTALLLFCLVAAADADQLRFDSVRDARLVAVEVQSIGDNLTLNI